MNRTRHREQEVQGFCLLLSVPETQIEELRENPARMSDRIILSDIHRSANQSGSSETSKPSRFK